MLVKMVALCVIYSSEKNETVYFEEGWNQLDFFIVAVSVTDMLFDSSGNSKFKALKALRAFRGLRPLRMISRYEGLKLIVSALMRAIPALGNVLMVCSLFMFIFAIVGINLFKGKMYDCYIPAGQS